MQSEQDFPVSIALLIAGLVVGALFYLQTFGRDPSVLNALMTTIRLDSKFWISTVAAAALNLGLIGSWVRRTIGLKKQGSRLQKLDGKSLPLFRSGDRYTIGLMAVTFLAVKNVCQMPLANVYGALGLARPMWAELTLVGNFVVLAACLWLLLVRLAPRFQPKSDFELSMPPNEPMTLVLGTTPMEVR